MDGTLAASILDMKFKDVLIACMGGVLLAGVIMGLGKRRSFGSAEAVCLQCKAGFHRKVC